jgi:hypothetical protein
VATGSGKVQNDASAAGRCAEQNAYERSVLAQQLTLREHRADPRVEKIEGDPGRFVVGPRQSVADGSAQYENDLDRTIARTETNRSQLGERSIFDGGAAATTSAVREQREDKGSNSIAD